MLSPRRGACRFGLLALLFAAPAAAAPPDCERLAKLALPSATISLAASVPAGAFSPPVGKPIPGLPAFCRVAGVIKPSPDSDIHFEVWLPVAGWTGKFQGVGNGGFAGDIAYGAMAQALRNGYATASTDTGHQSLNATTAGWALGHPEKTVDFGYRAVHETAVAAKAIVQAYYTEAPRRSYFSSCSNGGRQALMEAQRYPEDYDGIVAGAPANDWTHLIAHGAWSLKALLADAAAYIPAEKLPAIQSAALAACDALDGVKDVTIENPPRCHPDPATLLCKGEESPACLTAAQVATLEKLYGGSRTASGRLFFPGWSPGGEAEAGGWSTWITGPSPKRSLLYAFATEFFGNMVFEDPAWDFRGFDLDRDAKIGDDKLAGVLNATNPDLRRFRARGGKLILYHGWSDAAIPALSTVNYYQSVIAKMGARETDGFVRLFMVPGMQHCGGGPGATTFGQGGPSADDAEHNVSAAVERWVERGTAPDRLIAVRRRDAADPKSEVVKSHLLCPYPLVATFKGAGSTDDAAGYACAPPGAPSPGTPARSESGTRPRIGTRPAKAGRHG